MDFKTQLVRGNLPGDWNQKKSEEEFRGATEGMHVATVAEFRDSADLADLLTNPDRLQEFIQEGDNLLQVLNRGLETVVKNQPDAFGHLASLAGIGGTGPVGLAILAYDND